MTISEVRTSVPAWPTLVYPTSAAGSQSRWGGSEETAARRDDGSAASTAGGVLESDALSEASLRHSRSAQRPRSALRLPRRGTQHFVTTVDVTEPLLDTSL